MFLLYLELCYELSKVREHFLEYYFIWWNNEMHYLVACVLVGWHEKFPENPLFEPLKSMQELVKQGKLGVKTGEGYYKYDKK